MKKEKGFTLIETIISLGIMSLLFSFSILSVNFGSRDISLEYSKKIIKDLYVYKEKAYIQKNQYEVEFEKSKYTIRSEEGNIIEENILKDNVKLETNIKNNTVKITSANIIKGSGKITVIDKYNKSSHSVTIVPTTGRISMKLEK